VTTFRRDDYTLVGSYLVREGPEQYPGTHDRFEVVSEERRECRFHWRDKHGEGTVTIAVSADGQAFAGSWGLDVVQERLVWRGERQTPSAHSPRR
jgi:hypothetical protein